jgi:hypothetical protein
MPIRSITGPLAAVALAVLVLAAPAHAADYAHRADALVRAYAEAGRFSGTVLVAGKAGRSSAGPMASPTASGRRPRRRTPVTASAR